MNYLLDTNIIVYYYTPKSEYNQLRDVLNNEKNILYILNIQIPEVIATFYKFHYNPDKDGFVLTLDEANSYRNEFIMDIRKNKFFVLSVMDRDIILTDKIWEIAEKVYPGMEKKYEFISAIDCLLLAVAETLNQTKGVKNDFRLLSNDNHLLKTAEKLNIPFERSKLI